MCKIPQGLKLEGQLKIYICSDGEKVCHIIQCLQIIKQTKKQINKTLCLLVFNMFGVKYSLILK